MQYEGLGSGIGDSYSVFWGGGLVMLACVYA